MCLHGLLALHLHGGVAVTQHMSKTSTDNLSNGSNGGNGGQPGVQKTTGKLLATHGYVLGIEISGSGARQSVALADLNGNILRQVRRPLAYVPDTETVMRLLTEMLAEVMSADELQGGRILRVGVAVGGLVDSAQGIVRTLHHA